MPGLTDEDRELLMAVIRKSKPRLFGLGIAELSIIVSLFISVCFFYIRTNDMLTGYAVFKERTEKFMSNSDKYHSTFLGISFLEGQPENPNYDVARARDSFNNKLTGEPKWQTK